MAVATMVIAVVMDVPNSRRDEPAAQGQQRNVCDRFWVRAHTQMMCVMIVSGCVHTHIICHFGQGSASRTSVNN
jgi:hypothetical protein